MKRTLFASLFALCAIGVFAQNSANDSICVFDGTVTNVPDGTVVYLWLPNPEYPEAIIPDTITTVKGGRFHFEKAITAWNECAVSINRYNSGGRIKIAPGMKTVITGNGTDATVWMAENDHPDQKEANIYKRYKQEKLADYLALDVQINAATTKMYIAQFDTQNAEEAKAALDEANRIAKQLRPLRLKYFNVMSEFIKNRDFSASYENELTTITQDAYFTEDEEKMNVCRELFAKFPKDYNSQNAYMTKQWLYPPYKALKAGDQAKDYTLNDHDGKPHSILETLGKGKYLLLETARKACEGAKVDRPKVMLKELASKYADKFDIVTLAISPKEMFDMKEFPREEWLELGLNETSPFEEIQGTYFPREERFIFISPEGKILAKCGSDKLNEEFKKNFPFAQ